MNLKFYSLKKYFYKLLSNYCLFFSRNASNIGELEPKNDYLLYTMKHKQGKKKDVNINRIEQKKSIEKDYYDLIISNGNVHYDDDIQATFDELHEKVKPETRVVVCFYNAMWRPLIQLVNFLRISDSGKETHWVSPNDIKNFATLSDFEIVSKQKRILMPVFIPVLSYIFNKILAPLPVFEWFTLVNLVVLRPVNKKIPLGNSPSVSVVVAARNEAGNIENIVKRVPEMGQNDELIIVEGNSSDNTWQEMQRVKEAYHDHNIIISQQKGKGKGDAVRQGFDMASNDILMILDADLTVPPEDLPKFYRAIIKNKGEFINGSRLVYSMENQAMRFANIIGNKFFALAFSFVLNQSLKDTLCGTKVISRKNYKEIAANRHYFGDFDPFGDFDLIFGAAKLGLKIVELPIKYRARTYGDTNIQRWKHGMILFRMLLFASRKIKFI